MLYDVFFTFNINRVVEVPNSNNPVEVESMNKLLKMLSEDNVPSIMGHHPVGIRIIECDVETKQDNQKEEKTDMDYETAVEEFLQALDNVMSCMKGTWQERREKLLDIASNTEGANSQLNELAAWLEDLDEDE